MPTKKNTKPKKKNKQKQISKKTLLFIVLVVAVGTLLPAWIVYSNYRDRQRFVEAEQSIDALYKEIVAKTGQPNGFEKLKICHRASTKAGNGPINCSVTTQFYFSTQKDSDADAKMLSSDYITQHNDSFTFSKYSYGKLVNFEHLSNEETYFTNTTSIKENRTNTDCYVNYSREPSSTSSFYIKRNQIEDDFYIEISCSRSEKKPIYKEIN